VQIFCKGLNPNVCCQLWHVLLHGVCAAVEPSHFSWSWGPFLFNECFSCASTSCGLLNFSRCGMINCIFPKKGLHTCPYACSWYNIITINIISGLMKTRPTTFLEESDRAGRKERQVFWRFAFAFCNLHTSYKPSSHILFSYLCGTFTEFRHLWLKQPLPLCSRLHWHIYT